MFQPRSVHKIWLKSEREIDGSQLKPEILFSKDTSSTSKQSHRARYKQSRSLSCRVFLATTFIVLHFVCDGSRSCKFQHFTRLVTAVGIEKELEWKKC